MHLISKSFSVNTCIWNYKLSNTEFVYCTTVLFVLKVTLCFSEKHFWAHKSAVNKINNKYVYKTTSILFMSHPVFKNTKDMMFTWSNIWRRTHFILDVLEWVREPWHWAVKKTHTQRLYPNLFELKLDIIQTFHWKTPLPETQNLVSKNRCTYNKRYRWLPEPQARSTGGEKNRPKIHQTRQQRKESMHKITPTPQLCLCCEYFTAKKEWNL